MNSFNRRDFLKITGGVALVGGTAVTSQGNSVQKVFKRNDDCDTIHLWHVEGWIDSPPQNWLEELIVIRLSEVSCQHPYMDAYKDLKRGDMFTCGKSLFPEKVRLGDHVRMSLVQDLKHLSKGRRGIYRYEGVMLNKGFQHL